MKDIMEPSAPYLHRNIRQEHDALQENLPDARARALEYISGRATKTYEMDPVHPNRPKEESEALIQWVSRL